MAKKSNVFTQEVSDYLEYVGDIVHRNNFLAARLKECRQLAERWIDKSPEGILANASALALVDVINSTKWIRRAPFSPRRTFREDVIGLLDEMECRFFGQAIVAIHEQTEGLFRAMYGHALYQTRDSHTLRDKKAFHKARPRESKVPRTPGYFHAYAAWKCGRHCVAAIEFFQNEIGLERMTITGWGDMCWPALMDAIAHCRHLVVHADGEVNEAGGARLSPEQQAFVDSIVRPSLLTERPQILPDKTTTKDAVIALASFAHGIYVIASDYFAMEVDLPFK